MCKPTYTMKKLFSLLILTLLTVFGYAQNSYDSVVMLYHYNTTAQYGIKIKTNIPYQNGTHMPTIKIEGYNYGTSETIGLALVWYIYENAFYNASISSWGGYTPVISLAKENDKVVIFIANQPYYQRFKIEAFAQGMSEQASWFTGWEIVDEALTGTNVLEVPYKNRFKGNTFLPGGVWASNGNVGIGNTNPLYKLDVTGSIGLKSENYGMDGIFRFLDNNGTPRYNFYLGAENRLSISDANGSDKFVIVDGKVGIGTTNPQSELAVAGTITAKKMKVTITGWPDYVFAQDYKLPSIAELDEYIKHHKHLPDIPSAEEVIKEGIDVGEMNKKLLQKIEELTLHIIDLNKRMATLEKK